MQKSSDRCIRLPDAIRLGCIPRTTLLLASRSRLNPTHTSLRSHHYPRLFLVSAEVGDGRPLHFLGSLPYQLSVTASHFPNRSVRSAPAPYKLACATCHGVLLILDSQKVLHFGSDTRSSNPVPEGCVDQSHAYPFRHRRIAVQIQNTQSS